MKMQVLLVGGFYETKRLAISLIKRGYHVTAINDNNDDCVELAEIDRLTVINGDGSKPFVLEDAGAYDADIAIALTDRDEDNLVICELCKKKYNVKRTVALISDPKKTDFFYRMGIDTVVCAITMIANAIEQHTFYNEIATMIPISERRVQILQVPISGIAPAVDKKLWELKLPNDVIIGCILRGDKTMVPRGDTRILVGDILIMISSDKQVSEAVRELTGNEPNKEIFVS